MQNVYFIGLKLPNELEAVVNNIQDELQNSRLLTPLVPHITLLHPALLEEVDESDLLPRMYAIAQKSMPLRVELGEVATYDNRSVHISVRSPQLFELQQALVQLLPHDIIARHRYAFTPHVTLAQSVHGKSVPDMLEAAYREKLEPFIPCYFQADEITYFDWQKPRHYVAVPLSEKVAPYLQGLYANDRQ
jgi:2'-5' RNA ligase